MTAETEPFPPRALILADAIALICGDRNEAYGEPVANMAHIARVFNAITGHSMTASDVAMFHIATKLARLAKNPTHRDSAVDGPGYFGIFHECAMAERGE